MTVPPAEAETLRTLAVPARGRGRGELVACIDTDVGTARVGLGHDFLLDADLHAALVRAFGHERVTSEVLDPPHLSLVG